MKKIKTTFNVLVLAVAILASTACKNNEKKDAATATQKTENQQAESDEDTPDNSDFGPVLKNYFDLKDALVNSNETGAKEAGELLMTAIADFEKDQYPEKEDEIGAVLSEATPTAERISESNLEDQRKAFKNLSATISKFVTITGSEHKIYQDFCPMYDDGKGGMWLSASKAIKNPYYGDKMMKCGTVQKTFKP